MGKSVSHYAVIDEVEDGLNVVLFDDGEKLHLESKMLPAGVGEGTVLKVTFEIDDAEREKRESEISDIQERLLKRTRDRKK